MPFNLSIRSALVILATVLNPCFARYQPPRNVTWQYQLSDEGKITIIPTVQLYIIDIDTAGGNGQLNMLKSKVPGVRVICYFSVGSFENYRVEYDTQRGIKYPQDWSGIIGNDLDGWPGEKWLDIRSSKTRSIMLKRMKYATKIGCDGIDPDNVDGYQTDTGFPLTANDQFNFSKWLATAGHNLGLAVGLKNSLDLLPKLYTYFDFFVNEECFTFEECSVYNIVKSAPVLGVEYCDGTESFGVATPTQDPSCFCPRANAAGWEFLVKISDLNAPQISCQDYCIRFECGSSTGTQSCKSKNKNICSLLNSPDS